MKTYQINIVNGEQATIHYVKTDASKLDTQKAIDFVSLSGEKSIDKLLVALRVLGFTAREVKVEAEEAFDM
jgi:hypothetical protein